MLLLTMGAVALAAVPKYRVEPLSAMHDSAKGHINGFYVSHVWTADREGNSVVQHDLKYDGGLERHAQTLEFETFVPGENNGARTRTMAKLALVASYSAPSVSDKQFFQDEVMKGNGVYASDFNSEIAALQKLHADVMKEAAAVGLQRNNTNVSDLKFPGGTDIAGPQLPDGSANPVNSASRVVIAFTWTRLSRTGRPVTCLVFRGAVDGLDFLDSAHMAFRFVSERMQAKMKADWLASGLEWGETQRKNEEVPSYQDEILLNERSFGLIALRFGAYSVQRRAGIHPFVGLWPHVFAIAQGFLRVAQTAQMDPIFTGSSLGGARAAGASMFLKSLGVTIPAVTFGSVGSLCWPRRLNSGYSLKRFVQFNALLPDNQPPIRGLRGGIDTTVPHDQLLEYQHPLDLLGSSMGIDAGRKCDLGKVSLSNPHLSTVAEVCGKLFGLHGATVIKGLLQRNLPADLQRRLPLTLEEQERYNQTRKCLYLTHDPLPLYQSVMREVEENGNTLSGCSYQDAVKSGDGVCPYNPSEEEEDDDDFFTGTPGGPLFGAFIALAAIALIFGVVRCFVCPVSEGGDEDEEEEMAPEHEKEEPEVPSEEA